ncbi:MAG: acetoacetyl-CoA reductase [Rhodocyclaceae bacterium]|jgi:acetoacetyl-CoA reductase|nr:acetoacetyl-CoA reductase [Rhodocyclaceae bacterium]MCE2724427.1 acetoacetyl-CoA reductase [Betaproteobacteria bacterium]MCA3018551.1 acetoacetyl-CoA reductase [Rhodocyclaceae bacterium]MCA3022531.1 acetoacetyl-CoA reductase [Rhodocyclaceae bacterium]MCA3026292.1 acetoacetyl-CoA reductase [Rhodocyclaceae bacterium]
MKRRIALVTGGVGGIGTGISRRLAKENVFVIANYVIPGSEGPFVEAMRAAGFSDAQFAVMAGDVSDFKVAEEMVAQLIAQYGPVDILINCAGITRDASFRKMSLEQWRSVMSTNLDSVFNVTKQVIEGMVAQEWGRIISISSVNGVKGAFGQTNYAAAKAGILGFTKSLALEVAKKGVTVNAISPGFIDTPMTQAMPDAARSAVIAAIPIERMGVPADIANAVAYLASNEASYVTGTNLAVNGGVHLYQ